jgi:hypothetical protein
MTVRGRLARDGFAILAIVFVALRLFSIQPWAESVDAYAYWATRFGDYYAAAATGQIGSYLYSPAFAQVLVPLVLLPWPIFAALWTVLNVASYWWLVRALALPLLLFLPIPFEIVSGNVHLLFAAAIVIGFRWPAAWALIVLTKVTPGVGLVWFLVRREWRSFAIAIGATAAISTASFAIAPAAWSDWLQLLLADARTGGQGGLATVGWHVPIPLLPRLLAAVVVVAVAARTDRRWLVPVAVVLALPVLWLNGFACLAACVPLWAEDRARRTAVKPTTRSVVGPRTVAS